MAALIETEVYEPEIYQLETDDPVLGGEDGIDNLQAKQLANRTKYLLAQLLLRANIASPEFTGTPKAPTAAPGTNTTQIASTAFTKAAIDAAVASLIDSSPGALDTLNELAAALGDDANFSASVTNALALKAPLESPVLTGNPQAPTPDVNDDDTSIATTAFVRAVILAILGTGYAHLDVTQSFTKAQRGTPVPLPATTGSIALDLALGNNFEGTLTGNSTLANPSNIIPGQSGVIRITNGATPYTMAYGSYFKAPGGILPVLTAIAGAVDVIGYYVVDATHILLIPQGDSR